MASPKLGRRELLRGSLAASLSGCSVTTRETVSPSSEPNGNEAKEAAMKTRPLMTLRLTTAPTEQLGPTPHGERTTFPVTGGEFSGERLRGKVLPGGGDWTIRRADGVLELDLRVTLETDDGALVYMTFSGLRDDAHAYFRTLPRFETAEAKYAFLNKTLAVGTGEIRSDGPVHLIEELL
jgi:hypothetical protein